jgi:putative ABC transport system substrate-binding protein
MRRREFIAGLGSAAAWPVVGEAQQQERMRRIGLLMLYGPDGPAGLARMEAFRRGLQQAGWTEGRNVRIDIRWAGGDTSTYRPHAAELVTLVPDVIVAHGGTLPAALEATRTVPIVFVLAADPVGGGFVGSLARPGGNATGFTSVEYGISGKWLELLKEIAPRVMRVGVVRDASIGGSGQFGAIQGAAPSFGVEVTPIDSRDPGTIERGVSAFVRRPTDGLIVTSSTTAAIHRKMIIELAARYRLPSVYSIRTFVADGGLVSYGPEQIEPFRQAAGYVDRILRGENPAALPVQMPTKYETVLNLKTAKALGITFPPALLARADEVIE